MVALNELGTFNNGLLILYDKNREYKRIRYTAPQREFLASNGYRVVNSSCISGVQADDNDLFIRFHNGSVYRYRRAGGKFDNILASDSKGRYFNRNIKGKYPFDKLPKLTMPKNISSDELDKLEQMADDELFNRIANKDFRDMVKNLSNPKVKTELVVSKGIEFLKVWISGVAIYLTLSSLLKQGDRKTLLNELGLQS